MKNTDSHNERGTGGGQTRRKRDPRTLVGVIPIVLRNAALSIMRMPEAARQIIHGGVVIAMLLAYGRGERVTQ